MDHLQTAIWFADRPVRVPASPPGAAAELDASMIIGAAPRGAPSTRN
jgi:hypothetical protein